MNSLTYPFTFSFLSHKSLYSKLRQNTPKLTIKVSPIRSQSIDTDDVPAAKHVYKAGVFDDLFLTLFRNRMVQEVGWDSEKPGYDGLIEVANHLMTKGGRNNNSETVEAAVRILKSFFPPYLLDLYKMLVAPLGGGKVAAVMVARVTVLTCQWLMGPSTISSIDIEDGSSLRSGVLVERCKYLEESKCVGICINTCKIPTQTFFKDYMGVPLLMEPNYSYYSCQFKFGVVPPTEDKTLIEPCFEICPNANGRREVSQNRDAIQCPKDTIRPEQQTLKKQRRSQRLED
ncbi:hypothetical protein GIB67_005838 [Kingdonia uniflora]|uniref:Beta-carotene isomerase D27-like C-terminal domain-containing protein n=1 Tax=Kingdonia uniflora TaxID=39325 RepID=A0A7J7LUJ2_9MAGN|nr:hypothetical protein GIB67_005838 [Kingdonia uniflora]